MGADFNLYFEPGQSTSGFQDNIASNVTLWYFSTMPGVIVLDSR